MVGAPLADMASSGPKADPSLSGPAASNPFTAELGLLTKLVAPRVSRAKDDASLPAPKPMSGKAGRRQRSVPPLNELEVAVGEVQTLPTHGKLHLGVSSTNHAGLKEMLISRKARHEQAFEAYKKRTGQLEVELEARTAHVARSFKQLMALNDAELKTMFEELADDFLLQMEMEVRTHTLSTSSPPTRQRALRSHAPRCRFAGGRFVVGAHRRGALPALLVGDSV